MSIDCGHCKDHVAQVGESACISKNLALLQKDIEYLRRDQETILARFGKHVEDAEKDDGWHPRIIKLEDQVKNMRGYMIACGVIGGLVGSGSAEAVSRFLGLWK